MAINEFGQSISVAPELAEAYYNRAYAYAMQKKYGEAIADLDTAVTMRPSFSQAYFNRGVLHVFIGDNDKAIPDFSKAGELGEFSAYSIIKKIQKKK